MTPQTCQTVHAKAGHAGKRLGRTAPSTRCAEHEASPATRLQRGCHCRIRILPLTVSSKITFSCCRLLRQRSWSGRNIGFSLNEVCDDLADHMPRACDDFDREYDQLHLSILRICVHALGKLRPPSTATLQTVRNVTFVFSQRPFCDLSVFAWSFHVGRFLVSDAHKTCQFCPFQERHASWLRTSLFPVSDHFFHELPLLHNGQVLRRIYARPVCQKILPPTRTRRLVLSFLSLSVAACPERVMRHTHGWEPQCM